MAIIPGQSLTAEPKNAPYENPPQMTEPEEVVFFHLERLAKRTDDLLDAMELGLDVVTLTEGILRGAVMEGRHSVDVSLKVSLTRSTTVRWLSTLSTARKLVRCWMSTRRRLVRLLTSFQVRQT